MMKYSGVTFLAPLDWVEGGCPPFRATVDRMLWHIHINILLSRMLSLRLKVNLEKLEPRIGHRLDLPRFTRIPVQGKIGFLCSVSGSHVLHVLLPSFFFFFLFALLTLQWIQIWEILGMWGLIFEGSPQCFEFFCCCCCCFCVNFLRFCLITSVTHSAAPRVPLFCSYHILTSSVIYYWTDARQLGIYLLSLS